MKRRGLQQSLDWNGRGVLEEQCSRRTHCSAGVSGEEEERLEDSKLLSEQVRCAILRADISMCV